MAKIKSIEPIGQENVYNMEVEDHHNYSVNGGLIIHNCDAIRYFIAARPCPDNGRDSFLPGSDPGRRKEQDFDTELWDDDEDDDGGPGFYAM